MSISRIVIQPINELDADIQFNDLLTKYHALLQDKKADPLKEIIFYPFDREMHTYAIKTEMCEILKPRSISVVLPSVQSITEFLLLNSLGISDEDIRKHFNNE